MMFGLFYRRYHLLSIHKAQHVNEFSIALAHYYGKVLKKIRANELMSEGYVCVVILFLLD